MGFRDILKEHDAKYLLAKNQRQAEYLSAVWGWDISTVMLSWLHRNPSNFASDANYADFWQVDIFHHACGILSTLKNPIMSIISKIQIVVTSHFTLHTTQ